ncbi:MAG TPA: tetratricopeptide repeat protein [Verrucomicrobiae bacterium]
MTMRLKFFIAGACLVFAARLFAADTNSAIPVPDSAAQNAANAYLQIQAQLHDAQLAIENSRREAAEDSKQIAGILTARIQSLEENVAAQHANDLEQARQERQFTLTLASAFGLLVLAAVLMMAYLQWRAVARLVELSARRQSEFSVGRSPVASSLVTNAAGQASERLFGAVDELQKRILQLEQTTRGALAEKNSSPSSITSKTNGASVSTDRDECIANLLMEGQILLEERQAEKALECFDVALGLDAKNVEALVKKGGALEKMGRTDEAIACYDRAIEANQSATIAYLQKGGLFNRLARYDEALHCYEQALRTQEKNAAANAS